VNIRMKAKCYGACADLPCTFHSCCLCHCCSDSYEAALKSPRINTETVESSQPPRQESCTRIFLSRVYIVPFVIFFLRGGGSLLFYLPDQTFCFPDNPIPEPKKRCKYCVWAEYMTVILKRNFDRLQTAK
jgi:hypothetical protein